MLAKKTTLVIVGAGETARLAYEYFTHDSSYEVVGFSIENAYIEGETFAGLPVVPFEEITAHYDPGVHHAFVAISFTKLNRVRTRFYDACKRLGFQMASYVSSRAFVWRDVVVGDNCFILEQNVLQYASRVGNNVTLWSGNHVGHQSVIRDHVFVSSQVVISGYCDIGESSFLGVNRFIGKKVSVGDDCIIGAGAVVLRDTEPRTVQRGNPARTAKIDSLTLFGVDKP